MFEILIFQIKKKINENKDDDFKSNELNKDDAFNANKDDAFNANKDDAFNANKDDAFNANKDDIFIYGASCIL